MSEELTPTTGTAHSFAPYNGYFMQLPQLYKKELTEGFEEITDEDALSRSEAILSRTALTKIIAQSFTERANINPEGMMALAYRFEELKENPSAIVLEQVSEMKTQAELQLDMLTTAEKEDTKAILRCSYAIEEAEAWENAFSGTESFWTMLKRRAAEESDPPSIVSMMGFVGFDINRKAHIFPSIGERRNPNKTLMGRVAREFNGEVKELVERLPIKESIKPTDKLSYEMLKTKVSENGIAKKTDVASKEDAAKGLHLWTYYSLTIPQSLISKVAIDNDERIITAYEYRVYENIANLYNAGNEFMTFLDIANTMSAGEAGGKQTESVKAAVEKLRRTDACYDNTEEVEIGHYKYPNYHPNGNTKEKEHLLEASISGNTVHVLKAPLWFRLAIERGNYTTYSPLLIRNIPLTCTDTNIKIEDYILRRITANESTGHKLTFTILFEKLIKEISTSEAKEKSNLHDRKRIHKSIETFLDYLKNPNILGVEPKIAGWNRKAEEVRKGNKITIRETDDYEIKCLKLKRKGKELGKGKSKALKA